MRRWARARLELRRRKSDKHIANSGPARTSSPAKCLRLLRNKKRRLSQRRRTVALRRQAGQDQACGRVTRARRRLRAEHAMHRVQALKPVTRQLAGRACSAGLRVRVALLKRLPHRGLHALNQGRRKTETAVRALHRPGICLTAGTGQSFRRSLSVASQNQSPPTEFKEHW